MKIPWKIPFFQRNVIKEFVLLENNSFFFFNLRKTGAFFCDSISQQSKCAMRKGAKRRRKRGKKEEANKVKTKFKTIKIISFLVFAHAGIWSRV